jgi:hypothetical protein
MFHKRLHIVSGGRCLHILQRQSVVLDDAIRVIAIAAIPSRIGSAVAEEECHVPVGIGAGDGVISHIAIEVELLRVAPTHIWHRSGLGRPVRRHPTAPLRAEVASFELIQVGFRVSGAPCEEVSASVANRHAVARGQRLNVISKRLRGRQLTQLADHIRPRSFGSDPIPMREIDTCGHDRR